MFASYLCLLLNLGTAKYLGVHTTGITTWVTGISGEAPTARLCQATSHMGSILL